MLDASRNQFFFRVGLIFSEETPTSDSVWGNSQNVRFNLNSLRENKYTGGFQMLISLGSFNKATAPRDPFIFYCPYYLEMLILALHIPAKRFVFLEKKNTVGSSGLSCPLIL